MNSENITVTFCFEAIKYVFIFNFLDPLYAFYKICLFKL